MTTPRVELAQRLRDSVTNSTGPDLYDGEWLRIADVVLARDAEVAAKTLRDVRDDIQERRRRFRQLAAHDEYLNAMDDAYGLANSRLRRAESAVNATPTPESTETLPDAHRRTVDGSAGVVATPTEWLRAAGAKLRERADSTLTVAIAAVLKEAAEEWDDYRGAGTPFTLDRIDELAAVVLAEGGK